MIKKNIFILLIILASCQHNKKPENLLSKDKYKLVLHDLILAQMIKNTDFKNDSLAVNPILLVYKKYGIDSLTLKKSTDYYSNNPKFINKIYLEIKNEFKKKQDSLEKILNPHNKPIKTNDKIKTKKKIKITKL